MSDPRFIQTGFEKTLANLVEECGEVLAAAGKTQRWRSDSTNPLLKDGDTLFNESNLAWLMREVKDLKEVIARLEMEVIDGNPAAPQPPDDRVRACDHVFIAHQPKGDGTYSAICSKCGALPSYVASPQNTDDRVRELEKLVDALLEADMTAQLNGGGAHARHTMPAILELRKFRAKHRANSLMSSGEQRCPHYHHKT